MGRPEKDSRPLPAAEAATPSELVVNDFLPMLAAWNRLSEPVSIPLPQSTESLAENNEHKRQGESLRVPLARLDSLMREVGELIINRSAFEQRMADFARCVEEMQRAVTRMKGVAHDLELHREVSARIPGEVASHAVVTHAQIARRARLDRGPCR